MYESLARNRGTVRKRKLDFNLIIGSIHHKKHKYNTMRNLILLKARKILCSLMKTGILVLLFTGLIVHGTSAQDSIQGTVAEYHQNSEIVNLDNIHISVEFENTPLDEAILQLGEKSGMKFNYNSKLLPEDANVTYQSGNAALSEILVSILPSYVSYTAVQNIVILREKQELQVPLEDLFQETITGTVFDAQTGEALPGVNVTAQAESMDSPTGTSTNMDGEYEIEVPDDVETLVFSYIGYQRLEVSINGRTEINVEMSQDFQMFDDVVVVGYGTTRKESLTGSVSQISRRDLENAPTSRVDQNLQGRAPGVQVTSVSGEPGAPASIRIRGGNSIQGDNEPLWVIDGTIVGQNFNLNTINSNDIESIDILKDASAVSIYGTRGANGVILVTTKSGRGLGEGTSEVTFNTYSGIQTIHQIPDFLNGREHAIYANEDAALRGAAAPFSDPNNVPDVDWFDQVTKNAVLYNFDLSLSGVTENNRINYYVSGNHYNQDGVIRGSEFSRYAFRANIDYNISERVRAGFRANLSRVGQENNKVNIAQLYGDLIPVRTITNQDGFFTAENPISATLQTNAEADIQLRDDTQNITNILGNIFIEFQPIENIYIRSSFSPEINEFKRNRYNPGALPQNLAVDAGGNAQINTSSSIGMLNENTINYNTYIGYDHEIDLLGGFTWQTLKVENSMAQAFEFSNDVTRSNNLSFGSNPERNQIGSDYNSFQLVSWLGRANYTFKNRYLFTVVGRVDGASRFAEGNRFGFFPSGAVAWLLSQEEFIQDLDIFDLLKLRFSYGRSGSQAIPSYRTLGLLGFANTTFGGSEQAGVILGRPPSPDLTWETTEQYDIGLEATILNGRVSMEMDYYYKKTEDLLLNIQIPRQTGFNNRLQNLGEIENKGLEFMLNTMNVSSENFQWSSMFTISGNRNKVLDLAGDDFINLIEGPGQSQGGVATRLMIGQPAPVFVGVEYLGTWKSQQEIDESGQDGQIVGGPRFKDTNGDGQINEDDFEILGSPLPDFIFGFQNTISLRNWEFDFFFQGTYGNDVFNELTSTAFFGRPDRTKYIETLNRWTPDNPDSDIPRAGAVASLSEVPNNSEMIEDGSHIRLKNLRLTYNVPVERWGLDSFQNLSLYLSGDNLFVLSNYRLYDPETSLFGRANINSGFSSGEYPGARTLSIGIRATL